MRLESRQSTLDRYEWIYLYIFRRQFVRYGSWDEALLDKGKKLPRDFWTVYVTSESSRQENNLRHWYTTIASLSKEEEEEAKQLVAPISLTIVSSISVLTSLHSASSSFGTNDSNLQEKGAIYFKATRFRRRVSAAEKQKIQNLVCLLPPAGRTTGSVLFCFPLCYLPPARF